LLSIEARHKQLEVTARIDPALPARLRGDAGRVRQVLINLGNNAVKFTQRGQIAFDLAVLEQGANGTRVRCEVRDTGVGIPAEGIDALFKPFSQLDSSSTRRFGGTGLGLSISKRLIELMGGEVGVESEPGVGSRFWFTAHFKPSASTLSEPSHDEPHGAADSLHPAASRCHILLAEDNLVNQKVARRMLEKLGYRIDVAVDGRTAVEAWKAGNYDLILMDRHMPMLDGCGAAREIRRLEALAGRKPIPIIAFTADAMKGAEKECFDAGMDAYLTKPIDKEKLAAWIDRLTEPATRAAMATEAAGQSTPPVQWLRLVGAVGGDEDLARDVASLFVESGQTDMRSIIEALAARDYAALGQRASALKGASESVRATSAQVAAERLEAAARGGATEQIPELTDALAREVARTIDYLKQRVS
jgi:CheY-like chemotaxis protein/HPt (histidine-containing phosphotransfer) domain-containing protein